MDSSGKRNKVEAVLRIIESYGECNLNTIRRETGLGYYSLVKILGELVSKGLVVEKRIGRLRLFKLVESRSRA